MQESIVSVMKTNKNAYTVNTWSLYGIFDNKRLSFFLKNGYTKFINNIAIIPQANE